MDNQIQAFTRQIEKMFENLDELKQTMRMRDYEKRSRYYEKVEKPSGKTIHKKGSYSNFKEANVPSTSNLKLRSRDMRCLVCLGWGHLDYQCPNVKEVKPREACKDRKYEKKVSKEVREIECVQHKNEKESKSDEPRANEDKEEEKEKQESEVQSERMLKKDVNAKESDAKERVTKESEELEIVHSKETKIGLPCMSIQKHRHSNSMFESLFGKSLGTCFPPTLTIFPHMHHEFHNSHHISTFVVKKQCVEACITIPLTYANPFEMINNASIHVLFNFPSSSKLESGAHYKNIVDVLLPQKQTISCVDEKYYGPKLEALTYVNEINKLESKEYFSYVIMPKHSEVNMVINTNSQRYDFPTHIEFQFFDFTHLKVLYEHDEKFLNTFATWDEFFKFVFDPGGLGVCT